MNKHDLKGIKLQINTILSKLVSFISIGNPLRYSGAFDLSHPLSLITRQELETATSGKILGLWAEGEPTGQSEYRTHIIGGTEYLFRSLIPANLIEPTLDGGAIPAWLDTGIVGEPPVWSNIVTYDEDAYVTRNLGGSGIHVYKSIGGGNIGNTPETSPGEWEHMGPYVSPYDSEVPYDLGDFVFDPDTNTCYISQAEANLYPLDAFIPGSGAWSLIGAVSGGTNIGSIDKPSTGDITDPTQVFTFTDEELDIIGNDPLVSAYLPSTDGANSVETFFPNITPIIIKDADGKLVSVQIDFAEEGGMIRFSGANAGVTPTPGGTIELTTEGTSGAATLIDGVLNIPVYTSGGGGGLELGETSTTAYRGDRGKTAYDHSQITSGNPHGTTIADIAGLQTELDGKVESEAGKGLSENDYTDAEKTKLANLSDYFKGRYASLAALQSAVPVGEDGDYATVDTLGANAVTYIWDETDTEWVPGNPGAVTSVNGQTGPVILDTDDIGPGSANKYWTLALTVGAVLTGFIGGSSHVAILATDTIMQALQKIYGSIESIITTMAFKASIAAGSGTSTALTFGFDSVQGTTTTPLTGNITGSTSGAFLGITVLVIHNSGTEPTFDSKFKKLSGSGDYVVSVDNYIYCQYIDATHILYSINQVS